MDRCGIFIDFGYFTKVLEDFGKPRNDYTKLSHMLGPGEEHFRTYFYYCRPYLSNPPTPDEKRRQAGFDRFIAALEKLPRFQVRLGDLISNPSPGGKSFTQKGVDILLTIDLLKMSLKNQIQTAIIIACDSDFVPAINVVKDEGIIVKLCLLDKPGFLPHYKLRNACDDHIKIDQVFINKIKALRS